MSHRVPLSRGTYNEWIFFFFKSLLTVPFQTYDATFLYYTVWPAPAEYLSVQSTCPCTSKCQSPHQSAASRTDRQWVCVLLLLMSINIKKKNRLFYVRFKLVKSASQIQFSKTHFLRPGSLTTTANLKQTCPNQHFPIPDQSQLTDLQTRQHSVQEKQLQMQGK